MKPFYRKCVFLLLLNRLPQYALKCDICQNVKTKTSEHKISTNDVDKPNVFIETKITTNHCVYYLFAGKLPSSQDIHHLKVRLPTFVGSASSTCQIYKPIEKRYNTIMSEFIIQQKNIYMQAQFYSTHTFPI